MQKYFDLLLELLRPEDDDFAIEEKRKLSAAAKKMEERWNKKLRIVHKTQFIFEAYKELLNERITLDEFLSTWDITNSKIIQNNNESSLSIIHKIIDWKIKENDTLFILDSISFWTLSNNNKEIIQNRTKKHNCELVFC